MRNGGKMNRGVLYIGFGDNFIKEMLFSAQSVKKHCPNMHITAFVDKDFESEYVDEVTVIKVKHLRPKVDYIHKTPYDQTLFLDTDTIINRNVEEMFDILEKYDFAICHDLARKRENVSRLIPEYKKIPYSFSEVNPGVMVFANTEPVMDFFETWRDYFYRYFHVWPYEQPTFRVALWKSDLEFYILPVEYNIRSKPNREKQRKIHHEFGEEHLAPRIYHMHVDNINQGKYDVDTLDDAIKYCEENYMEY